MSRENCKLFLVGGNSCLWLAASDRPALLLTRTRLPHIVATEGESRRSNRHGLQTQRQSERADDCIRLIGATAIQWQCVHSMLDFLRVGVARSSQVVHQVSVVGGEVMDDDQIKFARLMGRVCTGSQAAAQELVGTYGAHVLRIVRRKLNQSLRPKFDSADFVQAVWASFFALPLDHYQFNDADSLVAFLMGLARNKVVEAVRQRLQTQKYNVNREQPLADRCGHAAHDLVGREPTPAEIAIAREEWEHLLKAQPEHYQQILVALRDGDTQQEVARQLGVNERTIRRVIRKLGAGSADGSR